MRIPKIMRRAAIITAAGVTALSIGAAGATVASAATNQDRVAISYRCGTSSQMVWRITVSGPNTAYVQLYNYIGATPYKSKAYNLKPGIYRGYKTTRISGLAAAYHDLGSGNPNLWVHTNAGSITTACVSWSKSGNGFWTSASFNIGTIPITLAYRFNCASYGVPGNFAVVFQTNYGFGDFLLPVNTIATGGSGTSALHPAYPGHAYWSDVNSECDWSIHVYNYTP